ncbi:hypothetical protein STRIP9103_07894, partial [Streptomyces ipomoeae 91-03]
MRLAVVGDCCGRAGQRGVERWGG